MAVQIADSIHEEARRLIDNIGAWTGWWCAAVSTIPVWIFAHILLGLQSRMNSGVLIIIGTLETIVILMVNYWLAKHTGRCLAAAGLHRHAHGRNTGQFWLSLYYAVGGGIVVAIVDNLILFAPGLIEAEGTLWLVLLAVVFGVIEGVIGGVIVGSVISVWLAAELAKLQPPSPRDKLDELCIDRWTMDDTSPPKQSDSWWHRSIT